jgi:type IV pilus biogenesis protein CpaD/CtpE
MLNQNKIFSLSVATALMLGACSPFTSPTSMNLNSAQLSREMVVEQIPMTAVTENKLNELADEYASNATGPLDLTLSYDPRSQSYTAMSALNDLKDIKAALHSKGVESINTQTLAVTNAKPLLMVNYDTITAHGPANCTDLPGLNDNETGRFIEGYKFGCSTETLIAKQIARPADLEGNDDLGQRSARREVTVVEPNAAGVRNQRLQGVERDMIASE